MSVVIGPQLASGSAAPWELPWQGKLGGPVGSVFAFSAAVQAEASVYQNQKLDW